MIDISDKIVYSVINNKLFIKHLILFAILCSINIDNNMEYSNFQLNIKNNNKIIIYLTLINHYHITFLYDNHFNNVIYFLIAVITSSGIKPSLVIDDINRVIPIPPPERVKKLCFIKSSISLSTRSLPNFSYIV